MHTETTHTTLGEMIAEIYAEFLALYGDEELASVATAAVVNDMLATTDDQGQITATAA